MMSDMWWFSGSGMEDLFSEKMDMKISRTSMYKLAVSGTPSLVESAPGTGENLFMFDTKLVSCERSSVGAFRSF